MWEVRIIKTTKM